MKSDSFIRHLCANIISWVDLCGFSTTLAEFTCKCRATYSPPTTSRQTMRNTTSASTTQSMRPRTATSTRSSSPDRRRRRRPRFTTYMEFEADYVIMVRIGEMRFAYTQRHTHTFYLAASKPLRIKYIFCANAKIVASAKVLQMVKENVIASVLFHINSLRRDPKR